MKNVCPKCGYENEEGARFCPKCGTFIKVQKSKTDESANNELNEKHVHLETESPKANQSSGIKKENNTNSIGNVETSKKSQTRTSCFGNLWEKPQTKNNIPNNESSSYSDSFDDRYNECNNIKNTNNSNNVNKVNVYKASRNMDLNTEFDQVQKSKYYESNYDEISESVPEEKNLQVSLEDAQEQRKIIQNNEKIIKNHLIFTLLTWILALVIILIGYFVPFIKYAIPFTYNGYFMSSIIFETSLFNCTKDLIQLIKSLKDSGNNMSSYINNYMTMLFGLMFVMVLVFYLFALAIVSIVKICTSSKNLSKSKNNSGDYYLNVAKKNDKKFSRNFKSNMLFRLIFSFALILILPLLNKIPNFNFAIPINGYNVKIIFVAMPLVGLITLNIIDAVKMKSLKKTPN